MAGSEGSNGQFLDVGGGYQLLQLLGRGTYGEVWRAEAPGGVTVAVKIIYRTLKVDQADRELQALEVIKKLRHHNLLSLQAFFSLADKLVIVLELADGDLATRLEECRQAGQPGIPPVELLRYMREVAEALDWLHARKVHHRDIKPANVVLLTDHAKVADFGFARMLEKSKLQSASTLGTPMYMAPELWRGKLSVHSHQYGLAAMYAELRQGQVLFPEAANIPMLMVAHYKETPDLSLLGPKEQQALLLGLAKDPKLRFDSCTELVQALVEAEGADPKAKTSDRTATSAKAQPVQGNVRLTDTHPQQQPPVIVKEPQKVIVRPDLLRAPFDARTAKEAQRLWADYLGAPVEELLDLGEGVRLALLVVPPGSFQMGSADDSEAYDNERPAHRVTIDFPLQVGKHQVTIAQFKRFVVAKNDYETEAERDGKGGRGLGKNDQWEQGPHFTWNSFGYPVDDQHPVANVTWNDAQEFVKWLSRRSGKKVRLLREAEWEYSCRAGTITRRYNGDDPERLAEIGNVADAAAKERFPNWTTIKANDGYVFTAPVGQFKPNAFGLFDMIGNVWEWCEDGKRAYAAEAVTNPEGAGASRVLRGGSFFAGPRYCRAAYRGAYSPSFRIVSLGFRVVVVR